MKFFEIFFYFLKVGALGFGGPLAIVSMIQKDLVTDKKWIPNEEFEQALALIKALPGALAFSTATYMGRRRGGFLGGLLAGLGLILPTFVLMVGLGSVYVEFKSNIYFRDFFYGLQGAALSLIVGSLVSLARPYAKEKSFWMIFVFGAVIFASHWGPEPFWILFFGLCLVAWKRKENLKNKLYSSAAGVILVATPVLMPHLSEVEKNEKLFWLCFKSGALVFGTGLAMIPFFQKDFVDTLHWLTTDEFFDAVALGQMTPGPVLMTTTWIGYRLNGIAGAATATAGVFLPSFIHMQTWFPFMMKKLATYNWIKDFVQGAISFILSTLLVVCFQTLSTQSQNQIIMLCFVLGCILTFKFRWKSWQILAASGCVGLLYGAFSSSF